MDDILEDVTFQDWRVIQELIERTLLLIEFMKINMMGFYNLRRYTETVMHKVFL